ncbi:hypothetical protein CHARACLAT_001217 [Characodon lateralis]|uniref:Uncharacterized protein n=1 Tax=Characodon lateralis TaxID=208331 RepID=A0ABU7EG42_9TELE|nr:hypothetical protein [Characodon lateralis]
MRRGAHQGTREIVRASSGLDNQLEMKTSVERRKKKRTLNHLMFPHLLRARVKGVVTAGRSVFYSVLHAMHAMHLTHLEKTS